MCYKSKAAKTNPVENILNDETDFLQMRYVLVIFLKH